MKPVTLITGGSAGIGAAFGREFARRGHTVVLAARREPALARVADAIAADGLPRPHVLPIDLGRSNAGVHLAGSLSARGFEPAIVVNNAGFGLRGSADTLDRNEQLAMVDLNIRALTDLSLRFTDSMRRHNGGIINMASVAAFFPGPGMAVYYASKAYVLSFSEALHQELKPQGIRVTVVCPGPVPTEFQSIAGLDAGGMPKLLTRTAERIARDAYDGFMAGQRLVVPGFPNRIATLLPRFLPRALVLKLLDWQQLKAAERKPKPDEPR
jgi:short-subunit dehydrogenase